MTPEGQRRIRALRAFSYSLDGVRLIAVAAGEEVSLRAGAAAGLISEGYAEPILSVAASALPPSADALTNAAPPSSDTLTARRRRAADRRT